MTADVVRDPVPPPMPPYRPCVGLALFNRDGRVFVGRRLRSAGPEHTDATHAWQMPQGGIDPGEDPAVAALRELHEETNVTSVRLLGEADGWFSYDLPPDVARAAWKGRYRGQTQKWFAFLFTGEPSEIDVTRPGGGKHRAEFDAWRWERLDEVPALVIPFKRPVYEKVVAAFGRFARPADATGAPT